MHPTNVIKNAEFKLLNIFSQGFTLVLNPIYALKD